jgi:hypothetical protein
VPRKKTHRSKTSQEPYSLAVTGQVAVLQEQVGTLIAHLAVCVRPATESADRGISLDRNRFFWKVVPIESSEREIQPPCLFVQNTVAAAWMPNRMRMFLSLAWVQGSAHFWAYFSATLGLGVLFLYGVARRRKRTMSITKAPKGSNVAEAKKACAAPPPESRLSASAIAHEEVTLTEEAAAIIEESMRNPQAPGRAKRRQKSS